MQNIEKGLVDSGAWTIDEPFDVEPLRRSQALMATLEVPSVDEAARQMAKFDRRRQRRRLGTRAIKPETIVLDLSMYEDDPSVEVPNSSINSLMR